MPSPHSSEETQADARALVAQPGGGSDRDPDRARDARLRGAADGVGRRHGPLRRRPRPGHRVGTRARHGRRGERAGGGEHPGANSRQPDDGPLEQVRLARLDDRQQERDVGRIRHPLRRHGGRLRGDQGRAEDARVPTGPVPQRALGTELVPRSVLERAPSAELRPGQLDQDSLPPYETARPHSRRLRRGGPRPRRDRRPTESPPRSSTR